MDLQLGIVLHVALSKHKKMMDECFGEQGLGQRKGEQERSRLVADDSANVADVGEHDDDCEGGVDIGMRGGDCSV
jgi:hypothetical protein